MNRLGIELLTVFGLPPVQFINLAANTGCAHVSMALSQFPADPYHSSPWSLRNDAGLRRETKAAIADTGVSISLGEGYAVRENVAAQSFASDIALMAELGTKRVNIVAMDPDLNRCLDEIAVFAELAATAGMDATVEFAPGLTIADLPGALAVVKHVNQPHFRLLVDTMHLIRSGSSAADIAAVDPNLIGYIQLSDAPLIATIDNYMQEATFSRMAPGTGELPLKDVLAALPRDLVVSIEAPNRANAVAGKSLQSWVEQCTTAAQKLLP